MRTLLQMIIGVGWVMLIAGFSAAVACGFHGRWDWFNDAVDLLQTGGIVYLLAYVQHEKIK